MTSPSPSASLADLQPTHPSNTQTVGVFTGTGGAAAALPPNNVDLTSISTHANDLISKNQASVASKPQVPGYIGQTLPEMRKDPQLAELVRTELNNILSTMPSLQKATSADTSGLATGNHQQNVQNQQELVRQQMLQFQETQERNLQKFAAEQKEQLEAFQQQLGIPPSQTNLPAQPKPVYQSTLCHQPAKLSTPSDHPAYSALQGQSDQPQAGALAMDMETLLGLTVRSKQYRPYEFAKRTQLFYASNINERNCNFPCYMLGYLRHCLILMSGVVPSSENEIASRLTNLMNICEIAANNSNLNDFDCAGWQIGKAYGDRVFHEVETGRRTWEELPAHILPDIFLHAKDMVAMRTVKNPKSKSEDEKKKLKKKADGTKACSTYNTFKTGEGCAYEWSNSDKKCEFDHYCRKCFQKSGKKERHKALNCEVEADSTKKDE